MLREQDFEERCEHERRQWEYDQQERMEQLELTSVNAGYQVRNGNAIVVMDMKANSCLFYRLQFFSKILLHRNNVCLIQYGNRSSLDRPTCINQG